MAAFQNFQGFDSDGDYDDEGTSNNWKCLSCNYLNNPIMPHCEQCSLRRGEQPPKLEIPTSSAFLDVFLGEAHIDKFVEAYSGNPGRFRDQVILLLTRGVTLTTAAKARVFAVLVAHHEHETVQKVMPYISPSEMCLALKLLDGARKVRSLKRRKARLDIQNARQCKKRRIQTEIDNLMQEALPEGTSGVTGAFSKKVRKWMGEIPQDKLEFFLLNFPKEPWKEMADLVHNKPSDFALPYFLSCAFGQEPPEDSMVSVVQKCEDPAEIPALLEQYATLTLCYSFIRKKFNPNTIPAEAKRSLARLCPLEDVLWFYEEMDAPGVDRIVKDRLDTGESLDAGRGRSSYGKLMERLLFFQSRHLSFVPQLMVYAEQKLQELCEQTRKHAQDLRVVVFGDASASMEVAINTATIIGSLLSVCFNAHLTFFNNKDLPSPLQPSSANDVFAVTKQVRASCSTAPAASLWPFVERREKVDLFIVVTDEEENTSFQGHRFAALFQKYQKEVNQDARVFLVSFLQGPPGFLGKMHSELKNAGVFVRQFKFDLRCPDLSKLPHLLGLLSLELCAVGGKELEVEDEKKGEDGDEEWVLLQEKQVDNAEAEDVNTTAVPEQQQKENAETTTEATAKTTESEESAKVPPSPFV